MSDVQQGILAPIDTAARYLTFTMSNDGNIAAALAALREIVDGRDTVVGFGYALAAWLGHPVPGLTEYPAFAVNDRTLPSTSADVWVWLRSDDRGEIVLRAREIERALAPAFTLQEAVDGFRYSNDRDLSGYEDGTENPEGDDAVAAAIVTGQGAGLDGASFVAVQQWVHDFDQMERIPSGEMDHIIGRRRSDNEELDDAPEFAHVKRTAQESFEPEAFMLRRSSPWSDTRRAGLYFVAFGCSFRAFDVQMRRMSGAEDGIVDGLFRFTRPLTGAYFWCPPMKDGKLDLAALGL
ncbi:Dyp-type peroxidase [Burkholderia cenocepacia]|uniref:Dyp-type peroxidase n=1 Tax=Burkholderia cenocepacia TaxID=95486 RepID=UPI0009824C6E|nr:Dyp-type peroxidase [Burkholderia cenocepacia]AQQ24925.1 peroxidase [Burkholderia cenocepacia]ONV88338.1 peroxidase [Burkholderia cenocepacia]ONW15000.1 peroxidase [Burkholderia cenocepacia]ONW15893.1 peroxidase [Burkholderia cenocepacia]ONW22570.1 peroxidase [Burkholderia cenocepacia]